jgi:hypothetical protein
MALPRLIKSAAYKRVASCRGKRRGVFARVGTVSLSKAAAKPTVREAHPVNSVQIAEIFGEKLLVGYSRLR